MEGGAADENDCTNRLLSDLYKHRAKTKKVQRIIYKAELERAIARQQTVNAKVMKRKRSSTVEPVCGPLINFTGMKRLNATRVTFWAYEKSLTGTISSDYNRGCQQQNLLAAFITP